MAAWSEALLGRVLPGDVAALVVRHALEERAATRVQAVARGLLVRRSRAPRDGMGFHLRSARAPTAGLEACMGAWRPGCDVYAYDGEALLTDLEAWMGAWRPGCYGIELCVRHRDGVSSALGGEWVVVRSKGERGVRWTESLPDSWAMYKRAFACHGRPCTHRVVVERLS